ncbi:MAG: ribokinase [Planctomycetota bacterium]|jgi:ribokinase|nr:ribokinase [Planctomycetota bacterium]MDP6502775.1 ribokinase [Planctomycetota bacterium]
MDNRITVIGSSNVDFIMKVPHLPAAGETVTGGEYVQVFGGKGANTATAASRAGGQVTFMTCLGVDHFGRQMVENFRADRIDTSSIQFLDDQPCGTALIMVDSNGENCISVAAGANGALSVNMVQDIEALISESPLVLLQMEIPISTNEEVLRLADKHGAAVLLNYAPVLEEPLELNSRITYLVINELEASALSGHPVSSQLEASAAAEALRSRGPQNVLITLGGDGVVAATDQGMVHVQVFEVEPVDTTAAGDTFCGCLGAAIVEGLALPAAMRQASAAAAICVTRVGAQPSIPDRDEIEAFLALSQV